MIRFRPPVPEELPHGTNFFDHIQVELGDQKLVFILRGFGNDLAARIDDALVIETLFRPTKGARLMMDQRLTRDGQIIARVNVQAVCIDMTGRVKRAPNWMTQLWAPKIVSPS